MKKLIIPLLMLAALSCKKESADDTGLALGETNWELHFKNNSSFTFFAVSQLYFKANRDVDNYRSADSVSGTWKSKSNTVIISFDNGDVYTGTAITPDSISGALSASGNNGIWYALRR